MADRPKIMVLHLVIQPTYSGPGGSKYQELEEMHEYARGIAKL
jgi:hypothetical protein